MLAVIHHFPQRTIAVLLSITLLAVGCDDDDHKVTSIIDDNLESSIEWSFGNVNDAGHDGRLDNTNSKSSSHSLAITSTEVKDGAFSFWHRTWVPDNIPVGSSLELKVSVKLSNVTGDGVYIALRGDKGTTSVFFETTQGTEVISGNKDFQTYTVKLDSYPEGVGRMYIFLILEGTSTGTAYFDDISLKSHH